MAKNQIIEKDGKLVAVPVSEPVADEVALDEVSWFEDDEEDSKGWTSTISFKAKTFWIKELSRNQNKKVDERNAEISKLTKVLSAAMAESNKSDAKRTPEVEAVLLEKLETLPMQIAELNRANEVAVLVQAIKFWDIKGKREAPVREDIERLSRSHQTALCDRILQKSRIGRSDENFS